jgi:hypothetical protein
MLYSSPPPVSRLSAAIPFATSRRTVVPGSITRLSRADVVLCRAARDLGKGGAWPDTEEVTGSNPVAPTTVLLSRAFTRPSRPPDALGPVVAEAISGRRALPCLTKVFTSAGCRTCAWPSAPPPAAQTSQRPRRHLLGTYEARLMRYKRCQPDPGVFSEPSWSSRRTCSRSKRAG